METAIEEHSLLTSNNDAEDLQAGFLPRGTTTSKPRDKPIKVPHLRENSFMLHLHLTLSHGINGEFANAKISPSLLSIYG